MVRLQNYNINVNEDVLYIVFDLQVYIYWIQDFEGEVHSIQDLWTSNLQERKSNVFFEVGQAGQYFLVGFKNFL